MFANAPKTDFMSFVEAALQKRLFDFFDNSVNLFHVFILYLAGSPGQAQESKEVAQALLPCNSAATHSGRRSALPFSILICFLKTKQVGNMGMPYRKPVTGKFRIK
jgi:hypothetical protein